MNKSQSVFEVRSPIEIIVRMIQVGSTKLAAKPYAQINRYYEQELLEITIQGLEVLANEPGMSPFTCAAKVVSNTNVFRAKINSSKLPAGYKTILGDILDIATFVMQPDRDVKNYADYQTAIRQVIKMLESMV